MTLKTEHVLYGEMTPDEFRIRIREAPVAYLPMGTLEWHGEHMPLGSDYLQPEELFCRLARQVGGMVLPPLYLAPDSRFPHEDGEWYGMDALPFSGRNYPEQQLEGSAYWVPDEVFDRMLDALAGQLSRAGFRILVAHGHGPSIRFFSQRGDRLQKQYGLICRTCWPDPQNPDPERDFQCDHGAANETSLVMAIRPDLVDLRRIPDPVNRMPRGLMGKDPRMHASPENGRRILDRTVAWMSQQLKEDLASLSLEG